MLENLFGDNWQVIVPLIGAGVALFFPQLRPIIDTLIKPKPAPGPLPNPAPGPAPTPGPTPGPTPTPGPVPPVIFYPPAPDPGPQPNPQPGPRYPTPMVAALQLLLAWFEATQNKAGEQAIREAGRAIFDAKPETPTSGQ